MRSKGKLAALAVGSLAAVPAMAIDYSTAVTAATTEINSAMEDGVGLGILVLAAVIGWRVFKRFAKG